MLLQYPLPQKSVLRLRPRKFKFYVQKSITVRSDDSESILKIQGVRFISRNKKYLNDFSQQLHNGEEGRAPSCWKLIFMTNFK